MTYPGVKPVPGPAVSLCHPPRSSFVADLVAVNWPRLAGFQRWVFQPGMLFQAPNKWWGDRGPRYAPHEGLDLYSFADAGGGLQVVDQHTRTPAAFAGKIVKIAPDFLGHSIYLRHRRYAADGRQLISVYGHTVPQESLPVGVRVAAGEVIGTVSGFPDKKTSLLPHLHLTFAWTPVRVDVERLDWRHLADDPEITLIDPLAVI